MLTCLVQVLTDSLVCSEEVCRVQVVRDQEIRDTLDHLLLASQGELLSQCQASTTWWPWLRRRRT